MNLKQRHSHSNKYTTGHSSEDSTVPTAHRDLSHLTSNYWQAQGFNWKPTANQNVSCFIPSVYKYLFSQSKPVTYALSWATPIPATKQAPFPFKKKKIINSAYFIINFTVWLFPATQFIILVPYKLMKIKSPSAHAQSPCMLSRTSFFCGLVSHF